MKKNIAKDYINKVAAVMFYFAILVYSQCGYAESIDIPVEIPCSNSPIESSWMIFSGNPGIRYTIATNGIREFGKEGVAEVYEDRGISRTQDGLRVYIGANCMSSDKVTNVSLTGSALACEEGEGIRIRMVEPNDANLDKYHYVGTLTITTDEKQKSIINSKHTLQLYTGFIDPSKIVSSFVFSI